jgi:pimeloyl-ACP methyl ester carboxylesterase
VYKMMPPLPFRSAIKRSTFRSSLNTWNCNDFLTAANHPIMASTYHALDIQGTDGEPVRIAFQDHPPSSNHASPKATILLIHGFPQTSHQFRHVLPLLAEQGYRCIAPDYRGVGKSSKNHSDFRKTTMAADMIALLDKLAITSPINVIGHDIGGMVAFALASRFPKRVRSVCWGECPLPGTSTYYRDRTEHAVQQFHFIFHSVPDLPEALVAGRERIYISHFLNKITYNLAAFSEADIDFYAAAYAQPGAMRCAFGVYRVFEKDAEENRGVIDALGKCEVPTLILSGEFSRHLEEAKEMALEVTQSEVVEQGVVKGAAHYLAEESPGGFVEAVLPFLAKH